MKILKSIEVDKVYKQNLIMEKELLIVHSKDINKTLSCDNPVPVCKKHKRKVTIRLIKIPKNVIDGYPQLLTCMYIV